ncbi:MAG: glycine betaine/L-proline ABC transporter ATP-binding protein [Chloroflexi bacterium]|nr:glycine betaine/L-proline ABC transporter ATP-binding protein [Chloroflexota bacterium]
MDMTGEPYAPTSNGDEPRISVKSLWKVFGKNPGQVLTAEHAGKSKSEILEKLGCVVALQDVNFEVARGETFVVMGLSGSGKSTLIRCLIRLVEPTAGEISVDGEDILRYRGKHLTQFRRKKVAMVFQHFGLLPHRTIIENVAWGLEVQGIDKRHRRALAQEVVEQVGLKGWEDAFPGVLSGGMQQRVGLARALAVDPEILLMDEPFSALDPLIRREMQDEMVLLQERINKTIVFITHDLDEALKLGDRIAIMRDGMIIQLGIPEEIVHSPADSYVEEFTQGISKTRVMGAASIMQEPDAVVFPWQGPRIALRAMKTHDLGHAFVVDSSKRLQGVITEDQAAAAVARGITSFQGTDLINPDICPIVSPDTSIDDLVRLAAETRCPIAVVNDEGRLLGVVPRAALLSSLAEDKRIQTREEADSPA